MPDVSRTVNYQLSTVNCRRRRLGFTFIELLVVISIIAILLTAIIATFGGAQAKGRDSRRKQDLDALKKALELYKSDTIGSRTFPDVISIATLVTPGYIRAIPTDPTDASPYIYTPAPALCTTNCTSYTLYACLQNVNDTQKDTTNICTQADRVSYTIVNP